MWVKKNHYHEQGVSAGYKAGLSLLHNISLLFTSGIAHELIDETRFER
jgi:hypothetical protein